MFCMINRGRFTRKNWKNLRCGVDWLEFESAPDNWSISPVSVIWILNDHSGTRKHSAGWAPHSLSVHPNAILLPLRRIVCCSTAFRASFLDVPGITISIFILMKWIIVINFLVPLRINIYTFPDNKVNLLSLKYKSKSDLCWILYKS